MAKKIDFAKILVVVLLSLMGVAVGGLFITGATLSYPILKLITSATVHTIIGWSIVVGAVANAILAFIK